MTVSIDATTKKYYGRMAETYESKRKKQERWDIENDVVRTMLNRLKPKSILDVPCGTGRFIPTYNRLRVERVTAIDVSDAMLAQAKEKDHPRTSVRFVCTDVRKLSSSTTVDVSVCVRFLDLIDEMAMREVVKILMIRSERAIICTIRFGPKYIPKSNTATHDEKKFRWFLKRNGWKIAKAVPVFTQGWYILRLQPR